MPAAQEEPRNARGIATAVRPESCNYVQEWQRISNGPMGVRREPQAFGDQRGWIAALKAAGDLHEVDAEVDWNIEIGTILRLAQGPGTGPALLFNNIKDYNQPSSRCRRIFCNALNNYRRMALMLGL